VISIKSKILLNWQNKYPHKSMTMSEIQNWHGTTIILIRKDNDVVVAGDGQVSLGNTIIKRTAKKVRKIEKRNVIAGFAGSTADALTLFERLEAKLEKHAGNLTRAAVELAKDWRTDKYLRRLEALMAIADKEKSFIISGTGDVLEPEDGIIGIGSGGNFALAAAKVLMESKLTAEEIAKKAISVAAEICVYTNNNITVEKI
jgi:ATP-dependent HslUV protease subunit HslV